MGKSSEFHDPNVNCLDIVVILVHLRGHLGDKSCSPFADQHISSSRAKKLQIMHYLWMVPLS